MFNTLTQHRWPFNSAVQGDKRCRYAAERHRAKTLATSSVTSKVNPGRQYQAAATRELTSGQSSFDSVKPGLPFYMPCGTTRVVTVNFIWRGFTASFGGFNHFVGDGIQLSSAGSCWIRRYRVARDMPKSRATWVAGSPASMSFIALRI